MRQHLILSARFGKVGFEKPDFKIPNTVTKWFPKSGNNFPEFFPHSLRGWVRVILRKDFVKL